MNSRIKISVKTTPVTLSSGKTGVLSVVEKLMGSTEHQHELLLFCGGGGDDDAIQHNSMKHHQKWNFPFKAEDGSP